MWVYPIFKKSLDFTESSVGVPVDSCKSKFLKLYFFFKAKRYGTDIKVELIFKIFSDLFICLFIYLFILFVFF